MATLDYSEVRERRYIVLDGEPYEVLSAHVFRKQQRKPVNATKLKNLITGSVREHSFGASDKVEEADISSREITYLYSNKGEHWFCEKNDKSKRFQLEDATVGDRIHFMKANDTISLLTFDDGSDDDGAGEGRIVGLKTPVKVELKVKEAAPAVKGNTAQGGSKKVILETGHELQVPMFVNEGDVLLLNTETGEYVERVGKK